MSTHETTVRWARTTPDFTYDTYDRGHTVTAAGGVTVPASAAAEYKGDPSRMNPEEAFVGALSSCHMLTFLAICARRRLVVDAYEDHAVGWLAQNAHRRLAVTRVELRPVVTFAPGVQVSAEELDKLHHQAHDHCFIAQSVTTEVVVVPQPVVG